MGIGSVIVSAILLALADICATGHGRRTLSGPLLDWPPLGVHLSPADVAMVGASTLAAVIAWRRGGRASG